MKQKIKLRDLTDDQYKKWYVENCEAQCNRAKEGCVFDSVTCLPNSSGCWVKHKELYSDKFLDQEVEIEKEKTQLTKDEKVILRSVDKFYKYISRDKNNNLWLFVNKPDKDEDEWYYPYNFGFHVFNHLFQFIQWEDVEPYLIEDLLNDNKV